MAEKVEPPVKATVATHIERDGAHYPALHIKGDAPKAGAVLRVRLENGVVYSAKVHRTSEDGGETLVETEGLSPLTE